MQLALDAVARAEDHYRNEAATATRILESLTNLPSTSRSAADPDATTTTEFSTEGSKNKGKNPVTEDQEREMKAPPGGWFDQKGYGP